jgi:hypothetical protein
MSDAPLDPPDDQLMAALRSAVARVDGPPVGLHEANRGLLTWRDPDAELVALIADSRELVATVRGPGDAVLLRFSGESRNLTVEITPVGGGDALVTGLVEPGATGTVRIRRPGTETAVETDDLGRFRTELRGGGPVSFQWADAGGGVPIETPWLLV